MRVYTKAVIDIESGEIIKSEYYDYCGPYSMCTGGKERTTTKSSGETYGYDFPSAFLEPVAMGAAGTVAPAITGIAQLLQTILQTGGVGAQTPVVSRAVEASKRAGATAQQQTSEELARTGLAGTPFGERIRGQQAQEAAFQTSQVGPQLAMSLLQALAPQVSQAFSTAIGGLAAARRGEEFGTEQQISRQKGWNFGLPVTFGWSF